MPNTHIIGDEIYYVYNMTTIHIIELPTLRAFLRTQCRRFSHFPGSYGYKILQGVPLDSLGVGAIKIGHIIMPDRRQHCQEALKRIPVTPAGFLVFFLPDLCGVGGLGVTSVRSSHCTGAGGP